MKFTFVVVAGLSLLLLGGCQDRISSQNGPTLAGPSGPALKTQKQQDAVHVVVDTTKTTQVGDFLVPELKGWQRNIDGEYGNKRLQYSKSIDGSDIEFTLLFYSTGKGRSL
jgi:hypothetical protein